MSSLVLQAPNCCQIRCNLHSKHILVLEFLNFTFIQTSSAYEVLLVATRTMNVPNFVHSTPRIRLYRQGRSSAICTARKAQFAPASLRMGLSIKTAQLPKSQVSLEISVGKEECSAAWDSIVKELSKKSQIQGFRKGTAPKQLVINQYGKDRVMASACEEVIEKSIQKALKDSGIHAIGQAEVDGDGGIESVIASYDPQSPLTFKVKIDVWPEASFISSYENLEIEAEESAFDESLVEKALENLRQKEAFSVLAPEGTKAELGKLLVADLVGYYRNEDGSKGEKLPEIADGNSIEINMIEGKFMAGFVEGLIGAEVGETREVNVEFPVTNARPELAGVKAIFSVTIHAIKDVVLPELNDDFACQVSEEKSLEDFRKTIRDRLDTESEAAQEKNINTAIDNELAELVQVDLPESLVENQVKNKFATMLTSFKEKGMSDEQVKAMVTKENYELYKKRAQGNVEKSLRINFAVSRIAKDQNLEVDKKTVEDQMELVRAELKGEEMDEAKVRDQIEAQLERELVLAHIKKTAKISLVPKKAEE
eukprot:TRINITY_DN445_c0_g2_i1.p1 TRINITY_DN445_c0_g2~~TRINITY_DN445_c0_g2_i1.p1  ORF type:complete len:539 (+),score=107.20 TRINITY_DN445_c0_g2_i1:4391-6007(+)